MRKLSKWMLTIVMFFMFAVGVLAQSPGISLKWTFATTNLDGSPLTDLAGAKVYYGTSSSNYTHVIDVPGGVPGESKTFRLTASEYNLLPGVLYYFNGTAYNTSGLESDFCDEVTRSFVIMEIPGIIISEKFKGEVWRKVYEVKDGIFQQRWELVE